MPTVKTTENLVQMPVRLDRELKQQAVISANQKGVSIRQFTITALKCLIENDLDLTISEVIDRAKSKTDDRRWKNKINQ